MKTSVIDHVALTVPNIEQATTFFVKVFGARVALEGLTENDPAIEGRDAEIIFGMARGGQVIARRVLKLAAGANIELFEYANMKQQSAARTFDFGYQHIALYVSNLQQTVQRFLTAGGTLFQTNDFQKEVLANQGPKQGWLYGRTPWGSVIEMVTFKEV